MIKETLPYGQIQEIAKEVAGAYSPEDLPSLEDVAWAFSVGGRDRVYYHVHGYIKRIPNVQEGNAMRQLMTFRNFKNVLQHLKEGKTVSRGCIPNHTFPCGDADDGAYMVDPYLAISEKKKGREGVPIQKGFFWETLPSGLVRAVLKVERTGRGKLVDANGEEVERLGNNAYVDEELTRQYIQNMKEAYEFGREHFEQVVKSKDQSHNYPQLIVDTNPENWQEGQQFQWGYYSKGEPRFVIGSVLANKGDRLDLDVGNEVVWEDTKASLLREYGEYGLLWRLVPAGGRK